MRIYAFMLCWPVLCLPLTAQLLASRQVRVSNRPAAPLFQGEQGNPRTEIHLYPSTGLVTLKMQVQDPKGYFIPNIRREDFAVYENGVRERNVSVGIEHAPVTVGLLFEYGGMSSALNNALGEKVSIAAQEFLGEIGSKDRVAAWTYGDTLEQLSTFSHGSEDLEIALASLQTPPFSGQNFYDALIAALAKMRPVEGRKALIVLSSGLDTFSKATYQDTLRAVRESRTPVYVIDLGGVLQERLSAVEAKGPYARMDWKRASAGLQEIAQVSGGRLYSPGITYDLTGIYDDLMENLRVRYIVQYRPAPGGAPGVARTVRVDLVDPATGGPLEIVDASGKPVPSHIFVEQSYVPRSATP